MMRCRTSALARSRFAPLAAPRRRLVVRATAEPEAVSDATPSKSFAKPGKLVTEELFKRCKLMVDAGMSRDAAEACLTNTEWLASGRVREVADEVKALGLKFNSLDSKVNVLIGLVVLVLTCIDIEKVPNTLIGAALKKIFGG